MLTQDKIINSEPNNDIVRKSPISVSELLEKQFTDPKWVVDRLIVQGGINLLSADAGAGKTWIALLIAISVARGHSLLGEFQTTQSGVMFVEEEMGPRWLQERVQKLGVKSEESLPIYFLSRAGFKLRSEDVKERLEFCLQNNIKLIIFDSFIRMSTAREENSATEMAKVFEQINPFVYNGITTIITHHHRKQSYGSSYNMQSLRGSSDIGAAVDSHLLLLNKDSILTISNPKARHTQNTNEFKVKMLEQDSVIDFQLLGEVGTKFPRDLFKEEIVKAVNAALEPPSKSGLSDILKKQGVSIPHNLYCELVEILIQTGEISTMPGERRSILLLPKKPSVV